MLGLRDLISSMMTFLICLTGLAVIADPDAVIYKLQSFAEMGVRMLIEQLRDIPGLISSLLRNIKR